MAFSGSSQPVLCCGCAVKIAQPCRGFFRYFTLNHPIHPTEPTAPDHSEFISLGSKLHVRVIHVKPRHDTVFNFNTKRLSLSEEYWFTRWNKPLKTGICNCSFRRSLRYSAILDVKENSLSNYDVPPTRITNVETFVERLVQETLFGAFQEYLIKSTPKQTVSITDGISRRRRSDSIRSSCDSTAVLPADCVTVNATQISQSSAVQNNNLNPKGAICEHKNTANKVKVGGGTFKRNFCSHYYFRNH